MEYSCLGRNRSRRRRGASKGGRTCAGGVDYCAALLSSGISDHLPPLAAVTRDPCSSSHGAVVPSTFAAKQARTSANGGVMNFTFFSRPMQRPSGGESKSATASAVGISTVPIESTVVRRRRRTG
ncbi:hypothetical protein DAI22_06g171100 [Oryza sativa Japonica Group]|nr:hypothetical protein DAI22_06g171100 [Oryza sativa Japonica Group]